MATTSTTQYLDISHSEALADEFLEEARPNAVVSRHVNIYSIAGTRAPTFKLNRWNSIGRAGSAVQGVRITETVQFGTTAQEVTPTEFAVMIGLITNDAIELRSGFEAVGDLFNRGSFEEQFAAILPEMRQINAGLDEKLEYECAAALTGFSRSVGNTGVAFAIDDFDDALMLLENGEDLPHDDIVFCGDKQQHGDIRKELMVTSGGVAGVIWDKNLASIVEHRQNMTKDGLKGQMLGVPFFVHGKGVRQFANGITDVVGGMFLRGYGNPEQGGAGQPGAIAFVEGRRKVWTLEGDHRERAAEPQGNWKGAVAERQDLWGVKAISLAPAA